MKCLKCRKPVAACTLVYEDVVCFSCYDSLKMELENMKQPPKEKIIPKNLDANKLAEELGKYNITYMPFNIIRKEGTIKKILLLFDLDTPGLLFSFDKWEEILEEFYKDGAEQLAIEVKRQWKEQKE